MRVLGVDPGLTRCGMGVVDGEPGRPCRLVAVDVVGTDPHLDLAARLLELDDKITLMLITHRPDAVAVERVFSQHNVRTVMGTAQAGAVAVLAAARAGLPVRMYTPSEVKAAVTGSGQADKAQITTMVTRLLKLTEAPRPADAADALALAICHVWRGGSQEKLLAASAAVQAAVAQARVAQARTAQATARARAAQASAAQAGAARASAARASAVRATAAKSRAARLDALQQHASRVRPVRKGTAQGGGR